MSNIERGYEQIRFEETEKEILKHLLDAIDDLDLSRIEDPELCRSLITRLGSNILIWLPPEVGLLEINDRICLERPVEDKENKKIWNLDDVEDYITSTEAPPYPGPSSYTPGGL